MLCERGYSKHWNSFKGAESNVIEISSTHAITLSSRARHHTIQQFRWHCILPESN